MHSQTHLEPKISERINFTSSRITILLEPHSFQIASAMLPLELHSPLWRLSSTPLFQRNSQETNLLFNSNHVWIRFLRAPVQEHSDHCPKLSELSIFFITLTWSKMTALGAPGWLS